MDKLLYHLRFSFRVFLKDKFFSALNILGLSMGIAVGIILVLILKNDLTYDQHYSKHKNIYRLGSHYMIPDVDMMTGLTARELGPVLKNHYPEIEQMVRVSKRDLEHQLVKAEGKAFYEENIAETDSSYFAVFDHEFVEGDVNTCLDDPNNVVLTRSTARKYFGDESAVDRLLTIGGKVKKVSAVIADHPENTDLKFDFLLAGLPEIRPTWEQTVENGKPITLVFWNPDSYTFLMLPDNYDVNNFYNRFQPIFDEYFAGLGDGLVNTPVLQGLDEIHFSGFNGEASGNMTYLLALSGIGVLIVILACINYMNLATAKAIKRSTEITMKRLSGSGRGTLVISLIGESILMSLISLVVAIGIVYIVLDLTSFDTLIGKHLTLDLFNEPGLLMASLALAISIGILSGIYPALYLTGIPLIASLKGSFKTGRTGLFMRKTLITFQFCVSMFVVLVTVFMSDQLEFARTKDLGFDRNNLLVVPLQDTATRRKIDVITNDMKTDPRIISASVAGQILGTGTGGEQMFLEGEKGMEQKGAQSLYIGDDYLETVGLKLLVGREFYKGRDDDESFIVNEALVKMMGWGDKAIGKKMSFFIGQHPGTVVGVIKDFNMGSLHERIEPLFMIQGHWRPGFLHLRLSGDDIPGVVEHVKQKWSAIEPEHPFEYFFVDQKYDEQYKADITQNTLLTVLSYVCITISLLGLLGLSAFTAVQRTKEIGVRKVLGASVPGILILLSKDILLLVIFAAVLAIPVSWFVIDTWLQGFAYRTPFNYLLYATTLTGALAFVLLITAFQSLKTATANPVDSLKYE
ncbi:MAG TPA: ABC transporter permease [Cyclobacteriaceae bacterium]|nr:ABC transporter permease [Cyclobacteriaceae bacterium]